MEGLKELAKEWRRRVRAIGRDVGSYRQCADELEAALSSASPRPAAQPGVVKARKGQDRLEDGADHTTYGIDIACDETLSSSGWWGNKVHVYGDPELRDHILSALAAPVSQEPVARSDVFDWLETELRAVDCRYRGDPAYDHDAYWFRDRALNVVAKAREIFASPQPLTGEPSEAEVRQAGDILLQHGLNAPEQVIYGAARALLAAKSKGGQAAAKRIRTALASLEERA